MSEVQEGNPSALPLEKRVVHKNWHVRAEAFEALEEELSLRPAEDADAIRRYAGFFKHVMTERNQFVLEKGLAALVPFVEKVKTDLRTAEELCKSLVTQAFRTASTKAYQTSNHILLHYAAQRNKNMVLKSLFIGLKDRNTVVVLHSVSTIADIVRQFGVDTDCDVDWNTVFGLLETRSRDVQQGLKLLIAALHQNMGRTLSQKLSDGAQAQLKAMEDELNKLLVEHKIQTPQKSLKRKEVSDSADSGAKKQSVPSSKTASSAKKAVDLFAQMPDDLVDRLESNRWMDRKAALEQLLSLLGENNRFVFDCRYGTLVGLLTKILSTDSNVVVVVLAAPCLGRIAAGLDKQFATFGKTCLTATLSRFKEKKASVVKVLHDALEPIANFTPFDDVISCFSAVFESKNPMMKLQSARFLTTFLEKCSSKEKRKQIFHAFSRDVANLTKDSTADVRDAATDFLATGLYLLGEKEVSSDMAYINNARRLEQTRKLALELASKRKLKEEEVNSTEPKDMEVKSEATPIKMKARILNTTPDMIREEPRSTPKTCAGTSMPASRATPMSNPSVPSAPSSTRRRTLQRSVIRLLSGLHSLRRAETTAEELKFWSFVCPNATHFAKLEELMKPICSNDLLEKLFSSQSSDILEAIDMLTEHMLLYPRETYECADLLLKWCMLRFFSENVQVVRSLLVFLQKLLVQMDQLSEDGLSDTDAKLLVPHILRLLGHADADVSDAAQIALNKALNLYPASPVFQMLMEACRSENPLQRAKCLMRMAILLAVYREYILDDQTEERLRFVASFIADQNSAVREAALTCLLQAYHCLGKEMLKFLDNIDDTSISVMLSKIEEEEQFLQAVGFNPNAPEDVPQSNVLKVYMAKFIQAFKKITTEYDEDTANEAEHDHQRGLEKYRKLKELFTGQR